MQNRKTPPIARMHAKLWQCGVTRHGMSFWRHSQSAAAAAPPYMQGQAITDVMHKLLHKTRDYNRDTFGFIIQGSARCEK